MITQTYWSGATFFMIVSLPEDAAVHICISIDLLILALKFYGIMENDSVSKSRKEENITDLGHRRLLD